jgi:hypothetical protein
MSLRQTPLTQNEAMPLENPHFFFSVDIYHHHYHSFFCFSSQRRIKTSQIKANNIQPTMIAMKKWSLLVSVLVGIFAAVPMTTSALLLGGRRTAAANEQTLGDEEHHHQKEEQPRELELWYYCKILL